MKHFKNTVFSYFYDECAKQFGTSLGERIADVAECELNGLLKGVEVHRSKVIQKHVEGNMLPCVAMYRAFKKFDETHDKAYELTLGMAQIGASIAKERNRTLGRISFGYRLFKTFCKTIIKKQYPQVGWDTQWVKYDNSEIHFDFKSCIYWDTMIKYGCPELCPVFCANDDTTLAGYSPNIIFKRSGTIARGQEKCDFHFINGKRAEKAGFLSDKEIDGTSTVSVK